MQARFLVAGVMKCGVGCFSAWTAVAIVLFCATSAAAQQAPKPSVSSCTSSNCIITWPALTGASSYTLYEQEGENPQPSSDQSLCSVGSTTFTCDIASSLQFLCANYTVYLRASLISGGNSDVSDTTLVLAPASSASAAPPTPSVAQLSSSSLQVTWTAPWRESSPPFHWVSSYRIVAEAVTSSDVASTYYMPSFRQQRGAETFVTSVSGLDPSTLYDVRVETYSCFGQGGTSDPRRQRTSAGVVVTDPPNIFTTYILSTYKFSGLTKKEFDEDIFAAVVIFLLRQNGFDVVREDVKVVEADSTADNAVSVQFQVQTSNTVVGTLQEELSLLPTPSCSSSLVEELAAVSPSEAFKGVCVILESVPESSTQDVTRDDGSDPDGSGDGEPAWRLPVIIGCSVGGAVLLIVLLVITCQLRGTYKNNGRVSDEIMLESGKDLSRASMY